MKTKQLLHRVLFTVLAAALAMAVPAAAGESRSQVNTAVVIHADGSADITVRARAEKAPGAADWRKVDPRAVVTEALAESVALGLEKVDANFLENEATLVIHAWTPRLAVYREGRWEVAIPGAASIVQSDSEIVVSVHHLMRPDGSAATFANRYTLPPGSYYDNYDSTQAVMSYRLPGPVVEEWRAVREVQPARIEVIRAEKSEDFRLEGFWELRLEGKGLLPSGASHVYLDLTDEDGKIHGNMIVEHRQLNLAPTVLPIKGERSDGAVVKFRAESNSGRTGRVSFSFDGRMGRSLLFGKAKFEMRKGSDIVRVSDHELTFFRP